MITFTERLYKAINTATYAHRDQKRKGSDMLYIVHPFGAMIIAGKVTDDEDTLIACLFHDIIEDVPKEYPEDTMRSEFGDRVVEIVLGVTKDDTIKDWKLRSDSYLKHLEFEASDESVLVSAADKIHNLMSILDDYKKIDDELWGKFNSTKEQQLWWYQTVAKVVRKRLPDTPLNTTLDKLVEELTEIVE